MKELKDTLLMPKTDFPMRGNLGKREVEFQKHWNEINLYDEILKKNEGKPNYILHDGPPYANGDIHMGHALNKVLKDFVVRYKNMSGFLAPYTPGWDTHGLPIENALTKVKKVNRKALPISEFRKLCQTYAEEQVQKQKEQFKRLGVIGDWDNPYVTYQPEFERLQLKAFAKMVEKGLVYKGLKPVYWSPSSESALAEAEIEYHDHKSPSIYVAMPVVDGLGLIENAEFIIWTTTPWTIPANLAICVGAKFEYVVVNVLDRKFVVGKELLDVVKDELKWDSYEIINEFTGKDLEGMSYKHPLYDRVSPVILGDHVTTEGGTGLVHTAPGHGQDDFIVGKQNGLEIYCPVDGRGYLDDSTGFGGMFVEDANKEIGMALEEKGALLALKFIKHSYPHDWRTRKPIIFRATEQWFASIENMKEDLLEAVSDTEWFPKWGELRMTNMIKDREEWCISRQRVWGVPIPAFYAEDGTSILDVDVINHVAELFGELGSNVWFEREAKDLLPKGFTHPGSPNGVFKKETDIMDVWFDSGTSHQGGLVPFGNSGQADLYLEGSDQYRGWFNSSLSTSVAMFGRAPYKTVVSHGFINDGDGRKMSKSMGNGIDPIKLMSQMGADILRMWVASVDYQSDVRISNEMMKQVSEGYRKIRNTYRFLLGNLNDYDNNLNKIEYDNLREVDQYVVVKLNDLVRDVIDAYERFAFDEVYRKLTNFVTFLSGFYMDFTKDILYIEKENSHSRRCVQTVFYEVVDSLIRLLTPILPHTADEAYTYLPGKTERNSQLLEMPVVKDLDESVISKFDKFMSIRNDVLKALEEARNKKVIGKSFQAHLILYPDSNTKELLESLNANLQQILIVSKLDIATGTGEYKFEGLSIDVKSANGHTCARCWQVVDDVEDEVCPRCAEII
ncbi:isoleucine--tRNA ligase [Mycoplasmatota bacterium]|nr:isoleucine--tRNA ligase [Mycoplasmatota bacterium]